MEGPLVIAIHEQQLYSLKNIASPLRAGFFVSVIFPDFSIKFTASVKNTQRQNNRN
jgi:hypothetical protein